MATSQDSADGQQSGLVPNDAPNLGDEPTVVLGAWALVRVRDLQRIDAAREILHHRHRRFPRQHSTVMARWSRIWASHRRRLTSRAWHAPLRRARGRMSPR